MAKKITIKGPKPNTKTKKNILVVFGEAEAGVLSVGGVAKQGNGGPDIVGEPLQCVKLARTNKICWMIKFTLKSVREKYAITLQGYDTKIVRDPNPRYPDSIHPNARPVGDPEPLAVESKAVGVGAAPSFTYPDTPNQNIDASEAASFIAYGYSNNIITSAVAGTASQDSIYNDANIGENFWCVLFQPLQGHGTQTVTVVDADNEQESHSINVL